MEFSGGASSEPGSEEEKEVVLQQSSESCAEDAPAMVEGDAIAGSEAAQADGMLEHNGTKTEDPVEIFGQHSSVPVAKNGGVGIELNNEVNCSSKPKSEVHKETIVSNANITEPEKPLNFNDFNSSEEMEVLELERLKSELQERGLKCGGTLQERAARLFLLKSKLPKKLLAKK
ncbi:replication stress response regulator SDE2-like [Hibiscus syriacus]|uniref:replication stress response regulator SDE2-like n=1 Tax=Hibiscus syriacus TaxID=106335 RepID=UPI001923A1F7|nr:replication stress response regulator SDE2-like [Hibiscus syriacus]